MTSLDRLPLTTAPDLDPLQFNYNLTPKGREVLAYYSPSHKDWTVLHRAEDDIYWYTMPGIDATDWPEVWAEIISKEQ